MIVKILLVPRDAFSWDTLVTVCQSSVLEVERNLCSFFINAYYCGIFKTQSK